MVVYGIFSDGTKATERSPADKLTGWKITLSIGFIRIGIEKVSKPEWIRVYLLLAYQVQARLSVVCNSAPTVNA